MKLLYTILVLLLMIVAPLTGAQWAGYPIERFIQFPPITTELSMSHASFSMSVFIGMLILILLIVSPFFARVISSKRMQKTPQVIAWPFPWWGWAGLLLMLTGWLLAWTRMPWMASFQTFTFTPPWLGYIIFVNALTYWRSGRSMLTHQSVYLLALFLASAIFWWFFEYLNLFVENWYYVNVGDLTAWQFFWYATLPFSTVLPAVISTRDYLGTIKGFSSGLNNFFAIPVPRHKVLANVALIFSTFALGAIAFFPDYLFPLLWLAPLVIITSATILAGKKTIFAGVSRGNWTEIYLLGRAALVCGFFWEMWNFYSLAGWEYSVPFVNKFHIFEMPLPGYAGYLPFGLQCGLVAQWIKETIVK